MARWKEMTHNQRRQQKEKIKKLVQQDYPPGVPREKRKLARNKREK